MDRRDFLKTASFSALAAGVLSGSTAIAHGTMPASAVSPSTPGAAGNADYTLRIATGVLELSDEKFVSTTLYNGDFPGPLLRFRQGRQTTVDIYNDTDHDEQVHWHGQYLPDDVDGADEEHTPPVPAHGYRREIFTPRPAGLRFYHTHVRAGADLGLGLYTGQAGPVYIEHAHEPGAYDREVFLTLKEFLPYLTRMDDDSPFMQPAGMEMDLVTIAANADPNAGKVPPGYELAYDAFAINGKMLGHGEPIRVKCGERVMLHVINASATENRSLALPDHTFKVVALDGNSVPHPAEVPVLWLGTAERVSAIVEMNRPGVWVLGETADSDREGGMGIVVEYAGATGEPRWQAPPAFKWDYRRFADPSRKPQAPDETIDMLITARQSAVDGFDQYAINGVPYDWKTMPVTRKLKLGRRYRLRFRNASDDIHPLHLHRHSFEITSIHGQPTAGVMKDVVLVPPFQTTEIDFTADMPGLTLFHCHMQQHMDYGFMALFETV
ncbi:MAG TPA: multicopper oxidase domain-containing protein [Rhodanobacteraceae bacterium]|nr:multicopper oxidase domain-containing protein [Rhodanobacteraceae bacterium]